MFSERTSMAWDADTHQARIADVASRRRHAPGAPSEREVATYGVAAAIAPGQHVVVLGMTPELRRLALAAGARVTAIDASQTAIDVYREWIDPADADRETIIRDDWVSALGRLPEPVDRVMGDGVFGNLASEASCRDLLAVVRDRLATTGRAVFRKMLLPMPPEDWDMSAEGLIAARRAGRICNNAFGFAMRFWAYRDDAYDPDSLRFTNAIAYDRIEALRAAGALEPAECEAIGRFVFRGDNLVGSREWWDEIVTATGFHSRSWPAIESWSWYYTVYALDPT